MAMTAFFLVFALCLGFITGYSGHEVMKDNSIREKDEIGGVLIILSCFFFLVSGIILMEILTNGDISEPALVELVEKGYVTVNTNNIVNIGHFEYNQLSGLAKDSFDMIVDSTLIP